MNRSLLQINFPYYPSSLSFYLQVPTHSHDTQNTKPVFAGGRVSRVRLNVPRVEPRIASFTYLLLARHALREEGLRWRLSN